MTAQRPGNLANLTTAAAARTAAATARADAGLREMLRTGQPVTFRGLARHAGVSLDFLYSSTTLRQRIQQLRDQQRTQPGSTASPSESPAPETTSSVVATLTAQLTDLRRRHREETTRLHRELETAHGENLILRRRLAAGSDPASQETSLPDPGTCPTTISARHRRVRDSSDLQKCDENLFEQKITRSEDEMRAALGLQPRKPPS